MTGGGTGGHAYPALTAIRTFQGRLAADSCTLDVLWIGTADDLEARVAPAEGIAFKTVATGKIRRSANPLKVLSAAKVKDMARVPLGVAQARSIVSDFQPDVALATGGTSPSRSGWPRGCAAFRWCRTSRWSGSAWPTASWQVRRRGSRCAPSPPAGLDPVLAGPPPPDRVPRAGAAGSAGPGRCRAVAEWCRNDRGADRAQAHNAQHLADAGTALALLGDVTGPALRNAVGSLLTSPARRTAMAEWARAYGRPAAADRLVEVLLSAASG